MKRRRSGFGPHVTASELARLSECEMAVMLEMAGAGYDRDAPHRRAGIEEHTRFERAAATHHDKGRAAAMAAQQKTADPSRQESSTRPSPCFVASAVYGLHAVETNELRRFRDRVLLRHRITAWLVPVYYALSPRLAEQLTRHPAAARAARSGLDAFRAALPARWKTPS